MDWGAVGAIGEVLGAIGVIVSLLYVATQVRRNTRSIRASAYQALCDASARFTVTLGSDPQVAATFHKGLAGVEELSPNEAAQFQWLFHTAIRQIENGHFQFGNGTMEAENWRGWQESLQGVVGSPGGRRMWTVVRPRMRLSFVEFVERDVLPATSEAATANFLRARSDVSNDVREP